MRTKIALLGAPEAIEQILFRLIHQPIPRVVGNALAGNCAADSGTRNTRTHNGGAYWKGRARMLSDVRR